MLMQQARALDLCSQGRGDVDELCDSCANLPLTEEDINTIPRYHDAIYAIGTLSEILLRPQCPVCRLLIETHLHDPQHEKLATSRRTSDVIKIVWQGGRKGFTCPGFISSGTRLCFLRADDVSDFGQGRRIHSQEVDTELLAGWLRRCQQEHGTHCEAGSRIFIDTISPTGKLPSRLIDVRRRCVVEVASPTPYVTLSYVWGKVETLRSLKQNKTLLLKPFVLDSLKARIPRTILDAMELVTRLGFSHLWVDALCIVQDDDEESAQEIQYMDRIYQCSLFTIIAAHGVDANAGLPGVRPKSRQTPQILEKVGANTSLVALYELDDLLRIPAYSTRGWTFQERVLSCRNIVFVNEQVFFQCQSRTWSEDSCYESEPSNSAPDSPLANLLTAALMSQDTPAHTSFTDLVMYYSERELSYESDALKAAAGLLRMLGARFKWEAFQGLPKRGLDAYLQFYPTGAISKRKRRAQFPSYSWAGWAGRVDWFNYSSPFSDDYGEPTSWVRERTWIDWYELGPDDKACSISDLPGIVSDRSTLKQAARSRLQREIPSVQENVEAPAVLADTSYLSKRRPYPFLTFWTVSIQLELFAKPDPMARNEPLLELLDRDCSFCGIVWYDGPPRQTPTRYSELILLSEADYEIKGFPVSGEKSQSDASERNEHHHQLDRKEGHSLHDGAEDEDVERGQESDVHHRSSPGFYGRIVTLWDYYWVMLIEWDNGIAERRGIGQIYKTAAEKSFPPGPVWKQIVLA